MTLIIGIKSKEGLVVASDGAATLGSMGQQTAQQPTKKLEVIKDSLIVGVSGPMGLGQLIKGKAASMWEEGKFRGKKPYEAMALMSAGFREHIFPEMEAARVAQQTIGNLSLSSALSLTLVAVPISKELCLFQFDQQGAPEQTTDELPFVSIGSGQAIADPFLGLLRRVLWSDHQPTLNEAIFAAVWALDHAIHVNAGGVAEPIQVITLSKEGSDFVVKELTKEELDGHREAVKGAEKAVSDSLLEFKKIISGEDGAVEIPQPPQNG